MFDFMPKEIDFSDEKQYEYLQDKMSSALQDVLSDEKNTLEQMENLLFKVQSWIQPFVLQILDFESFNSFSELEEKDSIIRALACYSYSIFESYYDFLSYFKGAKDRNHAIKNCLSQIDNILFNVFWWLDCDLEYGTENSYFLKAVNELLVSKTLE